MVSGTRRKPGRLGPYVEGHRARLLELGYSPLSVTRSLTALGHLGRWMEREHVDVDQLDADAVMAFLAAHVKDQGRLPSAGVLPLLDYLRAEGDVAPESAAPAAVRGYVQLAHRFLAGRVSPDGRLDMKHLTGADVTGFLLGECARVKPGSAGCYANRLRSLLRFLGLHGLTEPQLAALGPVGGRLARGRHPTAAVATGDRATARVVRPVEPGRRARFRDPHVARAARSAHGRGLPA
jgi:hypothetical protein